MAHRFEFACGGEVRESTHSHGNGMRVPAGHDGADVTRQLLHPQGAQTTSRMGGGKGDNAADAKKIWGDQHVNVQHMAVQHLAVEGQLAQQPGWSVSSTPRAFSEARSEAVA